MARVVWTEPALTDLDAIADYIAIDNRSAAVALVERVYRHVGQLAEHPESGSRPVELGEATRYRQIVEPPCRVLYRFDGERVYVVHVLRAESLLRMGELTRQPG